jgi:predicted transcriptional regulator
LHNSYQEVFALKREMNGQNAMKGLLTNSITEPCGLLCCAFGVKNSAAKVYFELLEGPKTVEDVAATIGRDRSVAQRYLKELVENNLAHLEKKSLERGGYHHTYRANSSDDIRDQILHQLDKWHLETRRFLLESWPTPR